MQSTFNNANNANASHTAIQLKKRNLHSSYRQAATYATARGMHNTPHSSISRARRRVVCVYMQTLHAPIAQVY